VEYHVARREAQARLHFDLAHRANPKDAGLANNLAWYLANTNPRDPERALVLVNDALTRQPGNASFLETRGQIHAQMGQDRSAIADLEVALGALGSRRAIHNTLAACYEKQGESELAKKHKALAQEAKK
jgi:tetratricopeptide (TPR) repeat protein